MIRSFSGATFVGSLTFSLMFASTLLAQEVVSELTPKTKNETAEWLDSATPLADELSNADAEPSAANALPTVADESDLFESVPMPRGPIHEAFAEPVQLTPLASPVIEKDPPVSITETPANRPAGEDMQWINGYWGWNENVERYLWVSGVWRKTPPGRRWEPGRWEEVDEGHQWVPGNWLPEETETAEVGGFQNVPASVELGPNQPAPENSFWVPGNWKPTDTPVEETPPGVSDGYSWRPGSWSTAHDDWVWVPAHYSWTTEGCRLVSGYWDYPWSVRGTVHACCAQPTENYKPVRINTEQRFTKLWTHPKTGCYYYGDYYGANNPGYVPWHQYHTQNLGYDPLYCHYSRIVGPRVGGDFGSYLDSRYAYNQSVCCGGDGRSVLGGRRGGGGIGRGVARAAVPIATAAAIAGSSGGGVAAATTGTATAAQATNAATASNAATVSSATNAATPATNSSSLANSATDATNSITNPLDNVSGDDDDDDSSGADGVAGGIGGGAAASGGASSGAATSGSGGAPAGTP